MKNFEDHKWNLKEHDLPKFGSCRLKDLNTYNHPLFLLWRMGLKVPCQDILMNGTLRWHGFPLKSLSVLFGEKKKKEIPTHWHLPVTESQAFSLPPASIPTPSSSASASVSLNISHECHFSFTKKPSAQLKASRQSNSEPGCDLLAEGFHFLKISQCEEGNSSLLKQMQTEVDAHIHTHLYHYPSN